MSKWKLRFVEKIPALKEFLHDEGKLLAFTNGCFDLLHAGHVSFLKSIKELGNEDEIRLLVAINSDASVRALKGANRPICEEFIRAYMVEALECVDYVITFNDVSILPTLRLVQPDILVKGANTREIEGKEYVESYGGRVVKLEVPSFVLSTTDLINSIIEKGTAK